MLVGASARMAQHFVAVASVGPAQTSLAGVSGGSAQRFLACAPVGVAHRLLVRASAGLARRFLGKAAGLSCGEPCALLALSAVVVLFAVVLLG